MPMATLERNDLEKLRLPGQRQRRDARFTISRRRRSLVVVVGLYLALHAIKQINLG